MSIVSFGTSTQTTYGNYFQIRKFSTSNNYTSVHYSFPQMTFAELTKSKLNTAKEYSIFHHIHVDIFPGVEVIGGSREGTPPIARNSLNFMQFVRKISANSTGNSGSAPGSKDQLFITTSG